MNSGATYRQLQPELDCYLPDWIADFIVFYNLAPNALDWYGEVIKIADVKDLNLAIEAWVQSGDSFAALPADILFELASFNLMESKFYKKFLEVQRSASRVPAGDGCG